MIWTRKQNPEEKMFNEQMKVKREEINLQQALADDIGGVQDRNDRSDLLRWQQELEDELIQLKMQLRNKELNERLQWVQKQYYDNNGKLINMPAMLNEEGISTLIGIVRPLLSRNLINSNLDEDFVYGMLRRTCDNIVTALGVNGQKWQAEFSNYSTIVRTIKNAVIPTPFRAVGGWTKKTDSTISKRFEGYTESGQKQNENKGFFNRIIGG